MRRAEEVKDRMNMDGEGVRPGLRRQVDDLAGRRSAGGMDEDVEPAETFCRALDEAGRFRRNGDVAEIDRNPVRSVFGQQRACLLRRGAAVDDYLAAWLPADAARLPRPIPRVPPVMTASLLAISYMRVSSGKTNAGYGGGPLLNT